MFLSIVVGLILAVALPHTYADVNPQQSLIFGPAVGALQNAVQLIPAGQHAHKAATYASLPDTTLDHSIRSCRPTDMDCRASHTFFCTAQGQQRQQHNSSV